MTGNEFARRTSLTGVLTSPCIYDSFTLIRPSPHKYCRADHEPWFSRRLLQRSAPLVEPLPGIHNVSIITLSGHPVGLAIAVILDRVLLDAHLLQLFVPDARLLLGLRLRVAMGE